MCMHQCGVSDTSTTYNDRYVIMENPDINTMQPINCDPENLYIRFARQWAAAFSRTVLKIWIQFISLKAYMLPYIAHVSATKLSVISQSHTHTHTRWQSGLDAGRMEKLENHIFRIWNHLVSERLDLTQRYQCICSRCIDPDFFLKCIHSIYF